MGFYIQVSEEEGEEPIELPLEEDNTLLLSTLSAQFPNTSGLKFRSESNTFRGVRLADGKFHPPEDFWGDTVYYCVFLKENKRKSDDNNDNLVAKTKRIEGLRCTDLIVLGLPYDLTDLRLRQYFESFGELLMAMIKHDPKTGQSKGYGFIRYANYESQVRVLSNKHKIDNRTVHVKIPISQEGTMPSSKIFVGRVTEDLSSDDLLTYFSKFGEVIDIFIPKPFRAFAFVTFLDVHVAQGLLGEDHIINGVSVHIGEAAPKNNSSPSGGGGYVARGASGSVPPLNLEMGGYEGGYAHSTASSLSPPNKAIRKDKQWPASGVDMPPAPAYAQQQANTQNLTTGLLSALGNLNPSLLAALNQASWELMNGAGPNNAPVPPAPMPYHGVPGGHSPGRQQYGNGCMYGAVPHRENWWNNGYTNTASRGMTGPPNAQPMNSGGMFSRRKNNNFA